tara:strand:+ start:198 stop:488 length:291 start_codon:yes stop_codon:yes gene_type:complete
MKFVVAEKEGPHGSVVVITDAEIINKKFEEEKLQLDLTKDFYQGRLVNQEEVVKLIEEADALHLTGKNVVKLGEDMHLVKKVIKIENVPHAAVVRS